MTATEIDYEAEYNNPARVPKHPARTIRLPTLAARLAIPHRRGGGGTP